MQSVNYCWLIMFVLLSASATGRDVLVGIRGDEFVVNGQPFKPQ